MKASQLMSGDKGRVEIKLVETVWVLRLDM